VTPVSGAVYTVAVSGIAGNGTLGLNLVDNGSIRDLAGNGLTNAGPTASFAAQQTFATGTNPNPGIPVGAFPESIALTDVNGDRKPDLVVANEGSSTVGVLLGNGDGSFQGQQAFPTGSGPTSVAVGDVNGDGKPDLVVANILTRSRRKRGTSIIRHWAPQQLNGSFWLGNQTTDFRG
jgi:FG-GAP-like repeat